MYKCSREHLYISGNDDISNDALISYNLLLQGKFLQGLQYVGYAISFFRLRKKDVFIIANDYKNILISIR